MTLASRLGGTRLRRGALLILAAFATVACRAPDPLLSFLDDESGLSFTHPPRWSVGFAEQEGTRYRFLTAPKVDGDKEALSVTLVSPTVAPSLPALAEAYLDGGSDVTTEPAPTGGTEWSFRDSSGLPSRLRLSPLSDGRFFGAWARGSAEAMRLYKRRLDILFESLRVEDPSTWPEDRFAGLAARAPEGWTRGSRLSSPTNATMQFKSLPLAVERTTATIHGFVTVSREPVPPPGDLEAFSRALKDRTSDTVVVLQHQPWPEDPSVQRGAGYVDFMRSGTTLTSTRIRRWISVRNGVGLILSCEARADAFDRLDPWCRRMARAVRLD